MKYLTQALYTGSIVRYGPHFRIAGGTDLADHFVYLSANDEMLDSLAASTSSSSSAHN